MDHDSDNEREDDNHENDTSDGECDCRWQDMITYENGNTIGIIGLVGTENEERDIDLIGKHGGERVDQGLGKPVAPRTVRLPTGRAHNVRLFLHS